MTIEQLHALLELGLKYGASDIHFRPNEPPGYRVHGAFSHLKHGTLSVADTASIASHVIGDPDIIERLAHLSELDVVFGVANLARFRAHIYRQRGNLALVIRIVPAIVKSLDELGLPPVIKDLALLDRGLVLVVGPSGSGKSTTLAAMIDHINRHRRFHIVTVEQPVEFLHLSHQSSVSQRQIGRDTGSLTDALVAVHKQDPDVIMIGELRTAAEIEEALSATESGKLVLSTIPAGGAVQAVRGLVSAFSSERESMLRARLSRSLKAVCAQRLLRRSDGQGRIAACEILLVTLKAREVIREGDRYAELHDIIDAGAAQGMCVFDARIAELLAAGHISREVALANASNRAELERRLTMG